MSASTRSAIPAAGWRRIPGPPRDRTKARLLRLYVALSRRFGAQRWWAGTRSFEIAVGAVLTQHTAWTNAARAVAALRARRLLDPRRLMAAPEAQLAGVLEHGGPTTHRRAFGATDPQTPTHRLKARRLHAFTRWLLRRYDGRFDGLRRAPLGPLRAELLRVPGLGPETVDTILLYAAHRPVFVADAYTRRVLVRHRLIRRTAGYEATRAFLEAHLPSDPALFGELHALFVASAKSD